MAYYYPTNYNQYVPYQNNSLQNVQTNMQPVPVQSGSLISVHNEEEARMYPIAPGNSVTFKDENTPYIYTKTMGFSQLDRPIFEKYKLIKEDIPQNTPQQQQNNDSKYALKNDVANLMSQIADIQEEILALKSKSTRQEESGRDD